MIVGLWVAGVLAAAPAQEPTQPPAPEQKQEAERAQRGEEEALAPDPEPLRSQTPEPSEPKGPPAFDRVLTPAEIQAALALLTAEYPERVRVESLGRSGQGHELEVAILTSSGAGAAREKPGLLFVDHAAGGVPAGGTPGQAVGGAEAVLALGWRLAEGAVKDTELAALLDEYVVYLMPACDPDARGAEAPVGGVQFDRNFPLGWLPDALREGSGAFPLARPESLGLARFLRSHPNLVLIVDVGSAGPEQEGLWHGAEFPSSDREALDALCEPFAGRTDVILRPWGRPGSPGGGLFDYAYQALGVFPVSWVGAGPDQEPGRVEPAQLEAIATGTIELLRRMPRMRIEPAGMNEVAPGLWEVDVAISNPGALPTLSALAAGRRLAGEIYLVVEGARLLATASKHAAEAPFETARLHAVGTPVELLNSTLGGGEVSWLRLILEGQAGSRVELAGVGARAGGMRVELELR